MNYRKIEKQIRAAVIHITAAELLSDKRESPSLQLLEAADVIGDIVQVLLGEVVQQEKIHTIDETLVA